MNSLGDPEVKHTRDAVRADQHVLRGHISVNDAQRLAPFVPRFVRRMQTVQYRDQDRASDRQRYRLLRATRGPQQGVQRLSMNVVHDDDEFVVVREHIQDGDHVGVKNPCRKLGFDQEHLSEVRVLEEVSMHPLGCHDARKTR